MMSLFFFSSSLSPYPKKKKEKKKEILKYNLLLNYICFYEFPFNFSKFFYETNKFQINQLLMQKYSFLKTICNSKTDWISIRKLENSKLIKINTKNL